MIQLRLPLLNSIVMDVVVVIGIATTGSTTFATDLPIWVLVIAAVRPQLSV